VGIVFLDANVLFSAAYSSDAGLQRLWELPDVRLVSSDYAVQEARRNLATGDQQERLAGLVADMWLVASMPDVELPHRVVLPDKDQPILRAAIGAGASHLLTGDFAHFGEFYGSTVGGVLILPPSDYLRSVRGRAGAE